MPTIEAICHVTQFMPLQAKKNPCCSGVPADVSPKRWEKSANPRSPFRYPATMRWRKGRCVNERRAAAAKMMNRTLTSAAVTHTTGRGVRAASSGVVASCAEPA